MSVIFKAPTGQDLDPKCLHCVVAVVIQAFLTANPEIDATQMIGAMLQVTAEFAVSQKPDLNPITMLGMLTALKRNLIESIEEVAKMRGTH